MKKLVYLFLTVLIVGCSSSDDSNQQSNNAQFVGGWENVIDDQYRRFFEFNADGTGFNGRTFLGQTISSDNFSWSSTNTTLTISYDYGDTVSAEYDFLTVDQVKFTFEQAVIIYDRKF